MFLEYSRYPHPGGLWDPPEPELDSFLFLRATNLFEVLFTILYLCHALLLYLRLCEEHLYCLGSGHDFAVSTSPVTLSGSQSFTAVHPNLESVSESANFVAGILNGVAP